MTLKPPPVYAIAATLALAQIGVAAAFKGTGAESWIEAALYLAWIGFVGALLMRAPCHRR